MSDRVYVVDANGERWRVLDVRFALPHHAPGEWSARNPPDPAASFRAFIANRIGIGGKREARSYHWTAGESRLAVDEAALQRQLFNASWWDRRPVSELIPQYVPVRQDRVPDLSPPDAGWGCS